MYCFIMKHCVCVWLACKSLGWDKLKNLPERVTTCKIRSRGSGITPWRGRRRPWSSKRRPHWPERIRCTSPPHLLLTSAIVRGGPNPTGFPLDVVNRTLLCLQFWGVEQPAVLTGMPCKPPTFGWTNTESFWRVPEKAPLSGGDLFSARTISEDVGVAKNKNKKAQRKKKKQR